jgi:hypothetical protein
VISYTADVFDIDESANPAPADGWKFVHERSGHPAVDRASRRAVGEKGIV